MANTKITALNELTVTPANDDVLAIVDISTNETKKIKVSTLGVGGSGTGTVTSVALTVPSALSVTGSPITTNGTLAISGAGTASQFIDGTGALQTTPTGTLTGVTGTAPIVSSGGTAPAISITAASTIAAGSMSAADKTKLDGIASGAEVNAVDDVSGGTGLTASPTTGNVVVSLDDTAVTAGAYTNANITVDAQGRITTAANGSSGGTGTVTNVATGTGLSGGPITTTGTIALANTAVSAGTYTNADITVDAQGRLTSAANGASGGSGTVTSVAMTVPSAFAVSGSPITTAGTLALSVGGASSEYIDGTGALQTFPAIPTNTNLANTNLTATGDRTYSQNGNNLTFSTGGSADFEVNDGGTSLLISGNEVQIKGLTYPNSDGTNGQVLTTNGSGGLSFTTVSGGGGVTVNSQSANRLVACSSTTDVLDGEANLTFNGTELRGPNAIFDEITISTTGAGSAGQYGEGSQLLTIGSQTVVNGYIYAYTSGGWSAGSATSESLLSTGLLGMSTSTNTSTGLVTKGIVYLGVDPGGSIGDVVYLDTASGRTTTTIVSTTGNVSRVLGYKLATNVIYFDPSKDWIVIS